jgi:hypothetical protein
VHQAVKGASPGIEIRYAVTKLNLKEDPSGIHTRAQLPIIMHIKKDRMGAGNTNDKSN